LHGELADQPPVALWRHYPVDDQAPEALAAAHLAFQQTYDFDLVKVTPASSYCLRDWGVEDVWEGSSEGTRRYTKSVISSPEDWGRLPVLDPAAPHLASQLTCLLEIRRRLGKDTPVLQTIFSPLAQAKHLAGEQNLLVHLRTFPDALAKGLETIARSTRAFIEAVLETGIDGVFYAVQHAQAGILSPDEFARFSRPFDLGLLNSARDLWCNMLHLHGNNVYFDAVADYPVAIINWHDRETAPGLLKAQEIFRGAVCGGLSRDALVLGTPAAIQQEADDALAQTHRRRLILSTGCVLPIVAPHGNIMAARESVRRSKAFLNV
jgi:uroporphyrinogen decarboxylase